MEPTRRGFLKLLGLTTLAGLTAPMVEALGDAKGVVVPGRLLDELPRPLVLPVSGLIQRVSFDDIVSLTAKRLDASLAEALWKDGPLLAYLRKIDAKGDEWRSHAGLEKMPPIWVPDPKDPERGTIAPEYAARLGRKAGKNFFWEEMNKKKGLLDSKGARMRHF